LLLLKVMVIDEKAADSERLIRRGKQAGLEK
jgi:hypothetical protein